MIKNGTMFVEVSKCGSRSIVSALHTQGYKPNNNPHLTIPSAQLLYGDTVPIDRAVLIVREPRRRFYSLLKFLMSYKTEHELTIIHQIEQQINPIVWPQSRFHEGDVEKHIFGSVKDASRFLDIPCIHKNKSRPKIVRNEYDDLINDLYRDDFELWNKYRNNNEEW